MARKTKAESNTHSQYYKDIQEFINDFKNETDRAAVILGAAKLDNFLYQIIAKALLPSPTKGDDLLEGDSPLATFSSRITICYRLGLIDGEFTRALHLIRRIRNSFAHEISGASMNSGGHTDRVRELVLPLKKLKEYDGFKREFFDNKNDTSTDFRCALTVALVRLHFLLLDVDKIFSHSKEPWSFVPERWIEIQTKAKHKRPVKKAAENSKVSTKK